MSQVNLDNAQFKEFTRFAQGVWSGRSVVKAGLLGPDGESRKISAKGGDWVWNFGRFKANQDTNNEVRKLFMDTILDMYGAKDVKELPEPVQRAMKLEDYGKGKPLTARRIMTVHKVIAACTERKNRSITREHAEGLIDDAVKCVDASFRNYAAKMFVGLEKEEGKYDGAPEDKPAEPLDGAKEVKLDDGQRTRAVGLMMDHGVNLTDNGQRILANYIVTAVASGKFNDDELDIIVTNMSKVYLMNVRNFLPGDSRFTEVDKQLTKYFQDTLKDNLRPKNAAQYDEDGIHATFKADAHRVYFNINGTAFGLNQSREVTDKFKSTIPNVLHRKALSSFLNQATQHIVRALHQRRGIAPTTHFRDPQFDKIDGYRFLLSHDSKKENMFSEHNGSMIRGGASEYTIEMGDGGTSAKVTVRTNGELAFSTDMSDEWAEIPLAKHVIDMVFEFDLSDPNSVRLTNSYLGQRLDPSPAGAASGHQPEQPEIDGDIITA